MDFKSRSGVSGRKSTQERKISENDLVRMFDCVYSERTKNSFVVKVKGLVIGCGQRRGWRMPAKVIDMNWNWYTMSHYQLFLCRNSLRNSFNWKLNQGHNSTSSHC
jgi:hypothetical protein